LKTIIVVQKFEVAIEKIEEVVQKFEGPKEKIEEFFAQCE